MAIAGNGVQVMDPFTEQLASLPQVQRTRTTGDGSEPSASPASPTPAPQPDAQPQQKPTLATASDADAFRAVDQLAKSQDRLRRNRYAIDLYHTWLDSNVQFGILEKIPNENMWRAKLPPGITGERGAAVPNKAADLCNKVVDALLSDPPKPNPQSHVKSPVADAAGDLASEFLRQNAGESGTNEVQQYRWALRNALTRSTSFLEHDLDEHGGGYQPYQIVASSQATDPSKPLQYIDPQSGQTVTDPSPVRRYVSASNQFVEQAAQADRVWLPKIVIRKHQRTKVVLLPADATIEEAKLAIVTDWCTLAEGMRRWPQTVGQMTMEQLNALTMWRPSYADMIVPFSFRGGLAEGMTGPSLDDVGALSPLLQKRMFFHRVYVTKSPDYPDGLKLDITGASGGFRLDQQTMEYTVTLPVGGDTTRCRDIPLVQVTPIQDVLDLDPMGWPFEARFDGSAQADATLIAEYLDALSRMARPHVFIPSTTSVDEDEWLDRSKPIVTGPQDRPPTYEQFPPLPPVVEVSEHLQTRQDTASGLTATAQGLDTETSQSGIAKRLTVRQAQISLAGIQQQLHAAFTRGWRIDCQIAQASFDVPQLMQFSGDASSNEETWWTGEDFGGIDDIGIEPGTGTMMTAEDKANYIAFLQQQGWKTPEEAAEIGVAGIARDLGLPADPIKAAIEREIDTWLEGPSDPNWITSYQAWRQGEDAYQQGLQAYQQQWQLFQAASQNAAIAAGGPPNPLLGPEGQNAQTMDSYQQAVIALRFNPLPAVMPQPPQPNPVPKPPTPFTPRPNDTEPMIAGKWMKALSQLQMTPEYTAQPTEWRWCVDDRYTTARQAVATASGAQPGAQPASAAHPAPPKASTVPSQVGQPGSPLGKVA